jgi:cytochrome d ubiquinol oxidase subunit I
MWLVVVGSLMSAFWIIVANSFMQHPEGYTINNGRAELADFGAVLGNSNVWVQFPHVLMGALVMGAFFVLGVSAFNLLRKRGDFEFFRRSINLAVLVAFVAILGTTAAGDRQGELDARENPMKLAAMEGLWQTESGAGWSLISIIDEQNHRNLFELKIPYILSILAFKDPFHEVKGINELQKEAEAEYGPGNYTPPVNVLFFAFRGMTGAGGAMILLAALGLFLAWKRRLATTRWYLFVASFGVFLPYISNTCGWLIAEMGRQPWVVTGVLKTEQAVSPNITATELIISLSVFAALYIGLAAADIFLMTRYAHGQRTHDFDLKVEEPAESDDKLLVGAY